MSNKCQLEKVLRMFLVLCWTLGTQGIYVKIRNDAELTASYKRDLRYGASLLIGMYLSSMWSGAEPFLAALLGEEGS